AVLKGIAAGCEQAGCALIGGETAEHPKAFIPGEYDLAGFAVGVVEKSRAIDGTRIEDGDALIGLASSGAHANGFSLIRRILDAARADISEPMRDVDSARALGDVLLEPTRIYVKSVLALLEDIEVKAMAHITGGGLLENTHRMFPPGFRARIDTRRWPRPAVFDWLQRAGNVSTDEMHRVFNCGIGMILVVPKDATGTSLARLANLGETAYEIGTIERCTGPAATVLV